MITIIYCFTNKEVRYTVLGLKSSFATYRKSWRYKSVVSRWSMWSSRRMAGIDCNTHPPTNCVVAAVQWTLCFRLLFTSAKFFFFFIFGPNFAWKVLVWRQRTGQWIEECRRRRPVTRRNRRRWHRRSCIDRRTAADIRVCSVGHRTTILCSTTPLTNTKTLRSNIDIAILDAAPILTPQRTITIAGNPTHFLTIHATFCHFISYHAHFINTLCNFAQTDFILVNFT